MSAQKSEILLVDDDCNDIELALLAFEHCNLAHLIYAINNSEEAMRCLHGWAGNSQMAGRYPRLVILDLKMPKAGGVEVLKSIRNSPQTANVPVVVLTSSRMPSDIEEAYRLGCNAYVVKPVDHKEYTRALNSLIDFWGELNLTPMD